uniref:Autophagy-related protein 18a n=1 Tax=Tetradesmus obliquus TaxID=3088 RepID=A0A383WHS1_TETOB|eukprot:jgi/Sobl393_1/2780/SZX76762.1
MAPVEVLSVSFNQDFGCFACGTTTGFRVYNCDPFKETFCRGFNNGGIGIVEMLFRCNILAIVGGGPAPKYPPTKVMIWDDHQVKCIGELSFRSQVRAVRLRRDRIVVALEHKVLSYNFADLKLLHQIETLGNARGLLALSSAADATVLACPGLHTGQVRIELYDRKQTKFISAHNTPLACLCLSLCGKRLATASDKGTLLRVWNTADGSLLQELRRGTEPAHIHSIAFSKHCDWLAVSSDKGTVHVFALGPQVVTGSDESDPAKAAAAAAVDSLPAGGAAAMQRPGAAAAAAAAAAPAGVNGAWQQQGRHNPTSMLSSIVKSYVPIPLPKYFTSEWSFAQYKLTEEDTGRSLVGFAAADPHSLVIITQSGRYHKVSFDPQRGGPCSQQAFGCYIVEGEEEPAR